MNVELKKDLRFGKRFCQLTLSLMQNCRLMIQEGERLWKAIT